MKIQIIVMEVSKKQKKHTKKTFQNLPFDSGKQKSILSHWILIYLDIDAIYKTTKT